MEWTEAKVEYERQTSLDFDFNIHYSLAPQESSFSSSPDNQLYAITWSAPDEPNEPAPNDLKPNENHFAPTKNTIPVTSQPIKRTQLLKCTVCGKSYARRFAVRHTSKKDGSPPCAAQFPCQEEGGSGCDKTFKNKKDRLRHRQKSCKALLCTSTFTCRCGKTNKRWDQFKKHFDNRGACHLPPMPGQLLSCDCEQAHTFSSLAGLEEHHKSTMGKAGRPRKDKPTSKESGNH